MDARKLLFAILVFCLLLSLLHARHSKEKGRRRGKSKHRSRERHHDHDHHHHGHRSSRERSKERHRHSHEYHDSHESHHGHGHHTSHEEDRPFLVANIRYQHGLDIARFAGTWYEIGRTTSGVHDSLISSGVLHITLEVDRSLTLRYGGWRNGRCIQPVSGRAVYDGLVSEIETVFTSSGVAAFLNGALKIVETDYNYAVLYGCKRLHYDGTCFPGHQLTYIISRRTVLPPIVLQYIVQNIVVREFGVGATDIIFYPHLRVCSTGHRVQGQGQQTSDTDATHSQSRIRRAYPNVLSVLPNVLSCIVSDIPEYTNFEMEELHGTWYFLWMMRGEAMARPSAKVFMMYNPADDAITTIFSMNNGGCLPQPIEGTLTRTSPASAVISAQYGHFPPALMHIVHLSADRQHMLTYQCFQVGSDGTCVMKPYIDLLSRQPLHNREAYAILHQHRHQLCSTMKDFVPIPHEVDCLPEDHIVGRMRRHAIPASHKAKRPQSSKPKATEPLHTVQSASFKDWKKQ